MSQRKAFENGRDHYSYQYNAPVSYAATHEVVANNTKGKQVGSLTWNTNEIEDISVHKDHQGKGIASGMLYHARRKANEGVAPTPVHSRMRTHAGHEFAKKTGGPGSALPEQHIQFLD